MNADFSKITSKDDDDDAGQNVVYQVSKMLVDETDATSEIDECAK